MKKRALSIIFAMVLLVACIPFTAVAVSAAVPGSMPSNAIKLTDGVAYGKYWTEDNDHLNCYNKIVVPSRGYITFIADKPFDDEGEMCTYDLTLYDVNGNEVWKCDTGAQQNTFSGSYTYRIGLKAGTYYMNVDPSFRVTSGSIYTQWAYIYTKASNWEIESNNTMTTATEVALNKTYYGVYAEESYSSVNDYEDYYKVKLTKGKTYRLIVGNAKKMGAGTAIMGLYDASGNEVFRMCCDDFGQESGDYNYDDFTVNSTGYYYLRFENDGHEMGVDYYVRFEAKTISCTTLKVSLSKTAYTYNGKVQKPTVTVKDSKGKTISSSNYTVTYPTGCKNAGTYKVTVKFKGNYSGTKTLSYKIKPQDVSKCKISLSATSYTYNGAVKKPAVTVKNAAGTKLSTGSYTVSYASGRKNVGTYKVTIKMKGNYTGTKTLTFKILPTKTSISKVTGASKSFKVNWSKKTTQVTGYEIQYSTSKTFKSAKTKTVSSYKTTSTTIKSLSAKKTYYVRVRTYKTVNGKKVYSLWSTVKTVKTK